MPLLVPKYLFRSVTAITPQFLRQKGMRALVLDVDNTLTGHGSQELGATVAAWLETMKSEGFLLMLASNNTKARVEPFARRLGVEYSSFCCKPSPAWLWQAQRRWGLPRRAIALVGDQIFTDLLAGSLYGVTVLMVKPMYEDVKPILRLKRRLEKPLLRRYYRRGGTLL
jgi:HAD superfamily phosphatase (TIGR01668 family)